MKNIVNKNVVTIDSDTAVSGAQVCCQIFFFETEQCLGIECGSASVLFNICVSFPLTAVLEVQPKYLSSPTICYAQETAAPAATETKLLK